LEEVEAETKCLDSAGDEVSEHERNGGALFNFEALGENTGDSVGDPSGNTNWEGVGRGRVSSNEKLLPTPYR